MKRQLETPSGTFGALPHNMQDSVAFTGASYPAKSLLLELVRQLNGRNNGHLQLSTQWLATRGWKSRDVILRARRQLVERGLIVQTKQGGLNGGASQYAVTWLAISNFVGLDITAMDYHPGAYSFMDKLPLPKNAKPVPFPGHVKPLTVPSPGTANALTVPSAGTARALLTPSTVPAHGNNVITNIPPVVSGASESWQTVLKTPSAPKQPKKRTGKLWQCSSIPYTAPEPRQRLAA
ncbi:MAG: hypothetical protein V4563_15455 [Pseudomonadota bacterium]